MSLEDIYDHHENVTRDLDRSLVKLERAKSPRRRKKLAAQCERLLTTAQCLENAMTLADHAEAWCREQGKEVPPPDSAEWQTMYEQWVAFAFQDFGRQK
jgi:hypothetical protein